MVINQLAISVATAISCIIGGFIGEIKVLGRKGVITIFTLLSTISIILMIIFTKFYEIISPIFLGLLGIISDLVKCYIVEIYPTTIRDIASSFINMTYRISNIMAQYIYIGFVKIHYNIPFILTTVLLFISLILIYFLPFEFAGKSLDSST